MSLVSFPTNIEVTLGSGWSNLVNGLDTDDVIKITQIGSTDEWSEDGTNTHNASTNRILVRFEGTSVAASTTSIVSSSTVVNPGTGTHSMSVKAGSFGGSGPQGKIGFRVSDNYGSQSDYTFKEVLNHTALNSYSSFTSHSAITGMTTITASTYAAGIFSNMIEWVAPPLPTAPTSVAASDGTYTTEVTINWVAGANADDYDVYRSTTNDSATSSLLGTAAGLVYSDSTAVVDTQYYYWVKSSNVTGDSAFSTGDGGWMKLSAPTSPYAGDGASTTNVDTNCAAVTGAVSYKLYRNTVNTFGTATLIYSPASNAQADTTATPDTLYYYWYVAVGNLGDSSESASDSGWMRLAATSSQTVSDGVYTNKVDIAFTLVTGAVSYDHYINTVDTFGTATLNLNGTTTPNILYLPTPGVIYYVWTVTKGNLGDSAESTSTTGYMALSPPTGVTGEIDQTDGGVVIAWTAATGGDDYLVERSTDDITFATLGNTAAVSYTDTTGVAGTLYYYRVTTRLVADAGVNDSAVSSSVTGSLAPTFDHPANITATDADPAKITISWDAVVGADDYYIYIGTTDHSGNADFVHLLTGITYDWMLSDADTQYYFFIKSHQTTGDVFSEYGPTVANGEQGYRPASAPNTVTGVLGWGAATYNHVQWTANADALGVDGYRVYRATSEFGVYTDISGLDAASPYDDYSATIGVTYYYKVKAERDGLLSASYSLVVSGTSTAAPTPAATQLAVDTLGTLNGPLSATTTQSPVANISSLLFIRDALT